MNPAPLLLALPLLACTPRGQLLLYVDTDAPVPARPGAAPDPERPPALFDTLRVEILRGGSPIENGARDFALQEGQFLDRRVSFGIAPPEGAYDFAARLQLFRGDRLVEGEPPAQARLRTTVLLPPVTAGETIAVSLVLRVEDIGRAIGEPTPIESSPGRPQTTLIGSWPGAKRVPCAESAGPQEACIPGGAYWFGDPHLRLGPHGLVAASERLVVVSPFFLDAHELTVGEFRKQFPKVKSPYGPHHRDLSQDPKNTATWCLWTDPPIGLEDLPINCLPKELAVAYCHSLGHELPTEAQFEFAASGQGQELGYPWGDDEPSCADAVWGRGGGGGPQSAYGHALSSCRPSSELGSPIVPGGGARDRVASLGQIPIVDLAGNLAELVRDRWSGLDEPYWAQRGVLVDPDANLASADDPQFVDVARGGNWTHAPIALRAGYREGVPHNLVSPGVGMRCVRPGKK